MTMTGPIRHRRDGTRAATWSIALAALALVLAPQSARAEAAASPWSATDHTQVRLVAAVGAVGEAREVPLGLHFKMAKGWKIYWRSPGDAGYPPRPDWSGATNLKAATVAWPAPERFSVLGFETLGYRDEVVLPIKAQLAEPGKAIEIKARVDFLTCDEICIPYSVPLALALPAGPAGPSAHAHLINRHAARVPGDGRLAGIEIASARFIPPASGTDKGTLIVEARSVLGAFARPDAFVEGPPELLLNRPVVALGADRQGARFEIAAEGFKDLKQPLAGLPLTVTLADGERAAEVKLAATVGTAPAAAQPAASGAAPSLALALALAVLGGLILNLMPCVLPVLSLKLLGLASHGGAKARVVRLSFVASAAGIVSAFLALAAALIALKASGAAIGWGIQFQQPWFLAAMTVLVVLFACNLWGFFEIALPRAIADLGEHAGHVRGLGGHFLTGAFATLLATPCSAPFLGTAVGFALARGPAEIAAVFAALGLGLALPYLAVALFPGLATRLPRPGRWMIRMKQVLGVALAATGVWLVSILLVQAGAAAALAVAVAVVAIALALYLRHRLPERLGRGAFGAVFALALAAMVAPGLLVPAPATLPPASSAGGKTAVDFWQPFARERIAGLVAAGEIVFVDVTAEWCLTCKANKALVLTKGEVLKRLTGKGVVPMQADWTRPDPKIASYLAEFGRYGIPFNVVYGPGAPAGIPLPELLTSAEVLAALDRAQGGARVSLAR